MAATFPLAVTVNLKDNLTTGWARMEASLRARGTSLQNWGKTASKYMTAPLTAFAALSVRAGMNWEISLRRIQRATSATGEEAKAFGDEVLEQSKSGTHSLEAMSAAAVEAAGEMRNLAEAQQLLSSSLSLSHVTGMDSVETLQSLHRVMNAYGNDAKDLPRLADILARADLEEGPGGLRDIADVAGKLAPFAGKMKVDEVVAKILAARRGGIVEWGQLTKGFKASLLDKPGDARTAFERAVAADFKATGKSPVESLNDIISLAKQQEEMAAGAKESLTSLLNAFNAVLIEGSKSGLMEGFKAVLQMGAKLLGWLGSLPPSVKSTVVSFGAFAAVTGPVVFGLGRLLEISLKVRTAYRLLTTSAKVASAAQGALSLAMKATPWGLMFAGLAAGAYFVIDNWELVKEKVGAVWEWATAKWDATWGWILKQIRAAEEFFGFGDNAPTFGGAAPSGGAGAAALPQSPYALALSPAIGVPPAHAEITLNIRGAPKGTSVQTRGDADVTTNLGLAMPHVLGN